MTASQADNPGGRTREAVRRWQPRSERVAAVHPFGLKTTDLADTAQ